MLRLLSANKTLYVSTVSLDDHYCVSILVKVPHLHCYSSQAKAAQDHINHEYHLSLHDFLTLLHGLLSSIYLRSHSSTLSWMCTSILTIAKRYRQAVSWLRDVPKANANSFLILVSTNIKQTFTRTHGRYSYLNYYEKILKFSQNRMLRS